jgi:hypothetical protein
MQPEQRLKLQRVRERLALMRMSMRVRPLLPLWLRRIKPWP